MRPLPNAQSKEAIRQLAGQMLLGRVVDGFQVAAQDPGVFTQVFIPVGFGCLAGYSKRQLARLAVFAVLGEDESMRWNINNWPMFASCRVWRFTDWKRALALYELALAAQNAALAEG
jgi:hypothetical protein